METVTISKTEYAKLKQQSNIDLDLMKQLLTSFKDIRCGHVSQVK